jgi:hypothetical protein
VKHYVGTFSDIVDEQSSHFAKSFYTSIAREESIGKAICHSREVNGGEKSLAWANYMLYGDPSGKLGDTEKREARQGDWQALKQILGRRVPAKESAHRSPLYFSIIAILLLALFYSGYSRFYSAASKESSSPTLPAVQSALNLTPVLSPKSKAPLSLSMSIIGQRKEADGSYTEVIVREGSVLRSRDNFQIHVETNRASHVYILLFDSEGSAKQHFPDPKIHQPGFIEAWRKIAIPEKDLWFWLDEKPGTETVYVLASEPMLEIRGLLDRMTQASAVEQKRLSGEISQRINLVERGVGGVVKGKTTSYPLSDSALIKKVTEILAGTGAVVRAISFRHE